MKIECVDIKSADARGAKDRLNELNIASSVISIETLYRDSANYGPYSPMECGIRVWYRIKEDKDLVAS